MSGDSALKYIGGPLACLLVLILLYTTGYNNGVGAVEAEREADRQAQAIVVANLNGQIEQKEKQHVAETSKIRGDLAQLERAHVADLARLGSQYAVSLRDSEQRATRYRTLADTGPDQCRSVASRAAELDASLVEGRSVVEELRATIELRDSQLRLVGSQITSDRQLYENYGTDRN